MRREIGWDDAELEPDWQARFVEIHARGAHGGELRYFVAELDGAIVGSTVALRKRSMSESFARVAPFGYIANVYVEERHRRSGAARALTRAAIDWLRSIGCGVVRLQASTQGRPVYESLGFTPSGEMELTL